MFTGIIQGVGKVRSIKKGDGSIRLEIEAGFDLEKTNVGDSISFNGCCLTVVSRLGKNVWVDVSSETIETTTMGFLKRDSIVNIERAMPMDGRLDGHLVQGHVDGIGEIVSIQRVGNSKKIRIKTNKSLTKYIVDKGAVAVDGVSLTINKTKDDYFEVTVIPHTSLVTTFDKLRIKDKVNLEVDIIGKYVEKLHFLDSRDLRDEPKITEEFLKRHGFMKDVDR